MPAPTALIPLNTLWTRANKHTTGSTKFAYHGVGSGNARISVWHTLLRSIGLKALIVWNRLRSGEFRNGKEEEKVLVSTSRKVSLARLSVHLLPSIFTLFIVLWNAIGFFNGPQISATATFGLQLLAKLHELLISASLLVMVLDVIRHELLHDGVSLGLLTSSFSVAGLNFLWSPNMLSIFYTDYSRVKKLFLFLFIAICCVMNSTVGPASAVLFVPTQVWEPYGGTRFYLGGADDSRWPSRLTTEHTGPASCREFDGMLQSICPGGGYKATSSRLLAAPEVVFDIAISDARYTRLIHGRTPWPGMNATGQITPEVWAVTSRADVSFMMQDLNYVYTDAKGYARGRNRRLRDFVDGSYEISETKLPIGRTVCGPPQTITNSTKSLPFPVLPSDSKWRNLSTMSLGDESWGPTTQYDIEDLNTVYVREAKPAQARTIWVPSSAGDGMATAGLAVISQNMTSTVGRGCAIDFRWATGQVYRASNSIMDAFETQIGKSSPPGDSQNRYVRVDPVDFFDPRILPYLGNTIEADEEWLDTAFPRYVVAADLGGYNMTTLEAMIDATTAGNPERVTSADPAIAYRALSHLELVIAVSFVDALARVGWYRSLRFPDDTMIIEPRLQAFKNSNSSTHTIMSKDAQSILNGEDIYEIPNNMSYGTSTVQWHTYGVAWTLRENGQYFSVVVLAVHLVLVMIHLVTTLWMRSSMDAWDSVTEVLLLAWNSMPTRRDHEFNNCSVGIYGHGPMQQKIKVMAVEEDPDSAERVELMVIDENGVNKDGRKAFGIDPDRKYR